jgi:DNA-binding LacI/PurR family transcriptional regulator
LASGAIRAATDLGLQIPRDLMLVTRHDGHRARESTPKLTAINLHLDRIAAAAVELLLERLGGQTGRRFIQAPPPELIVRESSDR